MPTFVWPPPGGATHPRPRWLSALLLCLALAAGAAAQPAGDDGAPPASPQPQPGTDAHAAPPHDEGPDPTDTAPGPDPADAAPVPDPADAADATPVPDPTRAEPAPEDDDAGRGSPPDREAETKTEAAPAHGDQPDAAEAGQETEPRTDARTAPPHDDGPDPTDTASGPDPADAAPVPDPTRAEPAPADDAGRGSPPDQEAETKTEAAPATAHGDQPDAAETGQKTEPGTDAHTAPPHDDGPDPTDTAPGPDPADTAPVPDPADDAPGPDPTRAEPAPEDNDAGRGSPPDREAETKTDAAPAHGDEPDAADAGQETEPGTDAHTPPPHDDGPDPTDTAPVPDPADTAPVPDPADAAPVPDPTDTAPGPDPADTAPGPDPTDTAPVPDPTDTTPGPDPADTAPGPDPTRAEPPPGDDEGDAPLAAPQPQPETRAAWFLPRALRTMWRRFRVETPEDWSLRFDFQPGVVGRTHPLPRNTFRTYRVELVRHTDGSALWHHTYRFPSYGAGIQFADFGGRPTDRGQPTSIYGFIQTPILPTIATVDILTTIGMGVTSGWNPPAFEDFPFERHPTTRLTSYIDLGFQARRRLTDRLDVLAGFSLNHFSNGGVGSPNRGLTVTAPRVAVQRSLGVRGPPRRREDRPPFVDRWETRLDGGLAVRGVGFFWRGEDGFGPRGHVQVAALKGSVWRRFYRIGQVGGGLEGSLETRRPPGTAPAPDADLGGGGSVGLYTGYEQIAGPFSIYLHFGTHLARTRADERPAPYYRVGTIMRFGPRWFTDVSFRFTSRGKDFSHDYIAWHAGYRFNGLPFPFNR